MDSKPCWITFVAIAAVVLGTAASMAQAPADRARLAAQGGRIDLLEDGALHVVLCGTGSPLPDAQRAGPCTAVLAGGRFFVVDAGPGASESIQLLGLPRGRLSALLLTHFHSDHIAETGELVFSSWAGGRATPLAVHGPEGVEQVVAGFQQAYALDAGYRTAHHGAELMPPAGGRAVAHTIRLDAAAGTAGAVIYEREGLRVRAFLVDHAPIAPAIGYRFDYAGRCVVISGDTVRSPSLVAAAKGCDLVVHEVLSDTLVGAAAQAMARGGNARLGAMLTDTLDYHTFPRDVFALAAEAGVRAVALTHLVPAVPAAQAEAVFTQGRDLFAGEIHVGADGMHFTLPPGSSEIRVERLGPPP
jgi:ribonuclease Z